MTYSTFYINTNSYSLGYYNGYVYIGSYSNGTIQKVKINNISDSTLYHNFGENYRTTCIKIYNNNIYCSLIDTTQANNGSISSSSLIGDPNFGDLISGPDVNSFVIYDNVIYYTTATSIISYNIGFSNFTTLINDTDQIDTVNILANPQSIDIDGYKLYFCNKNNNNIYTYDLTEDQTTKLCTLFNDNNNGLVLYGKYIYVCSTEAQIIKRINLYTLDVSTYETLTGTDKPDLLLMVNNQLYISSRNSSKVLTRPIISIFNTNFNLLFSSNIFTYTLTNNFTINDDWDEVGLQAGKIIINGNNNTITINSLNTDTLFFGGSITSANRLEIKNLNIVANDDLLSPLLRAYGYVKINNCHFEMTGNINNNGGLVYNNIGIGIYSNIDIIMEKTSAIINGKIGNSGGSLLGLFINGCNADISNCIAIVLDNTSELGNETIDQGAGVFVGCGVGQGNNVSISHSYCIFSGSMTYSAGVIAGKFFGHNGAITLNNFYAITNITSVVTPVIDINYGQYSYFLSNYYGSGGNAFNSITATNVNFLNFNINNLKLYATDAEQFDYIANVTKFTTFSAFDSDANNEENRIGTNSYYLNYKTAEGISSYKCYYPDNNKYEVLIGSNNKILLDRLLTIPDNTINKTSYDNDFEFGAYSTPVTIPYYTSSDEMIATIDNNIVSIHLYGTVTLTAYCECDETYSYVETSATLNISKPDEATELENIGLTDTVIRNILAVNLNQDSYLANVPVDFTWGLFDIPENITIARHNMLSIFFNKNNITRFSVDNINIGLIDIGTTNIYVYKPSNELEILASDINNQSVYINLFQTNDTFTFNNGSNYIITKQVANYKIQHASDADVIKYDGDTYVIGNYTIIFGGGHLYSTTLPCLTDETTVLTPDGYINITKLKDNDLIITTDNRVVPIIKIFSTTVKGNRKTFPYIIPQSSISKNYPPHKTLLSGGHAIKYKKMWILPKLFNKFKQDKSKIYIKYYHIATPNPEIDHLIINGGLIVEAYKGYNNIKTK